MSMFCARLKSTGTSQGGAGGGGGPGSDKKLSKGTGPREVPVSQAPQRAPSPPGAASKEFTVPSLPPLETSFFFSASSPLCPLCLGRKQSRPPNKSHPMGPRLLRSVRLCLCEPCFLHLPNGNNKTDFTGCKGVK